MHTLKPFDAAGAAVTCYEAKDSLRKVKESAKLYRGLGENFDFKNIDDFKSRSGAFFKVTSGFGYVVKGSGNQYANDYLVAIRGTAGLADVLTDLNVGLQTSSTGRIVHAGFNRTYKEIESHLLKYIPSGSNVHFCGHSLGGALATLAADWAVQNKGCSAKLYTFGSPRVGFKPFADRSTIAIGDDNIYRVHRSTDVVPKVPIWPFAHVPQPGNTCALASEGAYSPLKAHSVVFYAESLREKEWSTLLTPQSSVDLKDSTKDILSLEGVKSLGATALSLIGRVIAVILKAAGVVVQGGFIVGFSIFDMVSTALEKAYKVSTQINEWVMILLRKIASLVGVTLKAGTEITASFIRWLFQLMMSSIRRSLRFAFIEA